jgi:hypothetical protein
MKSCQKRIKNCISYSLLSAFVFMLIALSALSQGTASNPFTSLGNARSVTTAGIYYNNIKSSVLNPTADGNALHFDGSNDYIDITRRISGDFTIEFWVRTTQTGGSGQWYNGRGIVDAEVGGVTTDFGVSLIGSKLAFGMGSGDVTILSTSNINTGSWFHVAVTRQASNGAMKIYINGVLETSGTGATAARTTGIRIGGIYGYTGQNFNGTLDELRIWNVVRTAEEISANKDGELITMPSSLVNYFKFNQGTANGANGSISSLYDEKNTTDGNTLNGFAKTGTTSNFVTGATFSTSIATHPSTTQQNLCLNGSASALSVTASGASPYTYQWYSNASNSNSNGNEQQQEQQQQQLQWQWQRQ